MSDFPEAPDWWKATDGRWYPPPANSGGEPPSDRTPTGIEQRKAERDATETKANRGCLAWALAAIVLIVAVSLLGSDDDGGGDGPSSTGDLELGAFDVCTQFVKDRLRAPGTASFPNERQDDGEVTIRTEGANVYVVTSFVNAENGFGGEVRTPFVCRVRHGSGENWTLVNLTMD